MTISIFVFLLDQWNLASGREAIGCVPGSSSATATGGTNEGAVAVKTCSTSSAAHPFFNKLSRMASLDTPLPSSPLTYDWSSGVIM